jgi:hypothetical protein
MRDLASAAIEASSFGIVCAPDRSSINWRGRGPVGQLGNDRRTSETAHLRAPVLEHDTLLEVLERADVDRPVRVAVRRVRLEGRIFVRLADGERLGRLGRGSLVDAEEDKGGLSGPIW